MAIRPAGLVSDTSAAAATAFNRVELNPDRVIQVVEFQISHNGAANDTGVPPNYRVKRTTTVGTGAAGTVVELHSDLGQAPGATALVENTADGTLGDVLHQLFVPTVSGIIWVAAPGREFDCVAAQFIGIQNQAALPTGIAANVVIVWEE